MQIFYINLERRADRREFMERQFEALGLQATRIDAVTPDEISAALREEFCNPDRDRFQSVTTLCCSLSHVRVSKALLSGTTPHALVVEDDAVLSGRLAAFLSTFDLAPLADVVRIETSLRGVRAKRIEHTIAGVEIVRPLSWEGGSAGYIINRHAAAVLVRSRALLQGDADEVILHPFGPHRGNYRLLQTIPGLCIQAHIASALGVPDLGSDLNTAAPTSHTDQSRLARTRRHARLLFRREVVRGGQQFFHQLLGARKRAIPFAP